MIIRQAFPIFQDLARAGINPELVVRDGRQEALRKRLVGCEAASFTTDIRDALALFEPSDTQTRPTLASDGQAPFSTWGGRLHQHGAK